MSTEKKADTFAALILVMSIIAIFLLAALDFGGFYHTGAGANRYSCLTCEYSSTGDLIAQVVIIILLIIQIGLAINDLLPNKLIEKETDKYGLLLAVLTILFVIIGYASFIVTYDQFDAWPETGFYGTIIAGLVNSILFFLKYKNR